MATHHQPLTASQVAEYFLAIADRDDLISNLKLQKLCYYAQGFCLAETGSPLSSERLERWSDGPVVRDLYHSFKRYGRDPIPRPLSIDPREFPESALELMDRVYAKFGQFDAWDSGLKGAFNRCMGELMRDPTPWNEAATPLPIRPSLQERSAMARIRFGSRFASLARSSRLEASCTILKVSDSSFAVLAPAPSFAPPRRVGASRCPRPGTR